MPPGGGGGGIPPPQAVFYDPPSREARDVSISTDLMPPNLSLTLDQVGFGTDSPPPPIKMAIFR
jgi:hypothetical protein